MHVTELFIAILIFYTMLCLSFILYHFHSWGPGIYSHKSIISFPLASTSGSGTEALKDLMGAVEM